jgi:hypothetical protein
LHREQRVERFEAEVACKSTSHVFDGKRSPHSTGAIPQLRVPKKCMLVL